MDTTTATIASTPEQIEGFMLLRFKSVLSLEALGMKHSSGRSVAPLIRQHTGLKARKKSDLLRDYTLWLKSRGVI